ncbi:MAG TPA: asparagine synthase (glutamine-hydrolyzing), partial [Noviherbaspirillum sp.]|nr:asparagine synthase (glutamine-hydrolyzing) [Noviherbaspirillum sp.]
MTNLIRHRGPDDEGYALFQPGVHQPILCGGQDTPSNVFSNGLQYAPAQQIEQLSAMPVTLALGHRRLSIVDLSPLGHQPMCSAEKRYWIAYNGEVYNHLELRKELEGLGYSFISHSDTEVILAAYAAWGPQCLNRFNGMWGLAIYDSVQRTLFLARDRFGVKPLYLYEGSNGFAFASEIKAFTALPDWKAKANTARLLDFLIWNISDHSNETMFADVKQLSPGHYLLIEIDKMAQRGTAQSGLQLASRQWYKLPAPVPQKDDDDSQHASVLRALLEDSVRLRLRADVTVGSCLSGGLDSSTIVCLMGEQLRAQKITDSLHTFTARSNDAEFDESRYAMSAVERASSTAHFVTPEPMRLFDDLEKLSWHQDEPFLSTSIFAQWCVFNEARQQGVTVMLDGQGADETLCGYRGFFGAYLAGLVRRGRIIRWLQELGAMKSEIGFSTIRSLGYTSAYLEPRLLGLLGRFDNRAYSEQNWIRPQWRDAFDNDPFRAAGGRGTTVREMCTAQVTATNLPMLLRWEDRNSMAFSVEARVPFLDYRIVEHCLNLPDGAKLGNGISKAVLRKSMRGIVPDLILDRRDKMGFVTA